MTSAAFARDLRAIDAESLVVMKAIAVLMRSVYAPLIEAEISRRTG